MSNFIKTSATAVLILFAYITLNSMEATLQRIHVPPTVQNLPEEIATYLDQLPHMATGNADTSASIVTFVKRFSPVQAEFPWRRNSL